MPPDDFDKSPSTDPLDNKRRQAGEQLKKLEMREQELRSELRTITTLARAERAALEALSGDQNAQMPSEDVEVGGY
jgi:hypothetical protein